MKSYRHVRALALVPLLVSACKTTAPSGSFTKDDVTAGNGMALYQPYPNAVLPKSQSGRDNSALAGQPLTTDRRSVRILTADEAAPYNPAPGDVMIYNFRHHDTYWIAKFQGLNDPNVALVDQAIIQVEHFPPEWIAGHNELRVTFRADAPKIQLYDQVQPAPANPQPTWEISDIVLSTEAVPTVGHSFDIVHGTENQFALGRTIVSTTQKGTYMLKQSHTVNQYPIPIANVSSDPVAAQNLLKGIIANAITFSDKSKMNDLYNTYGVSCVTEMWALIDASLPLPKTPLKVPFTSKNLNQENGLLPLNARRYMSSRGIGIPNSAVLPDLGNDPTYATTDRPVGPSNVAAAPAAPGASEPATDAAADQALDQTTRTVASPSISQITGSDPSSTDAAPAP